MADAQVSKTCELNTREGSTPSSGTTTCPNAFSNGQRKAFLTTLLYSILLQYLHARYYPLCRYRVISIVEVNGPS